MNIKEYIILKIVMSSGRRAPNAGVLFLAEVNLSENPGGTSNSPVLQSPRDSLAYFSSAIESNQ